MLEAREEVAAWLGLSATGPALPPPPRRAEPPSRVPPAVDDVVAVAGVFIGRFPVTNAAFAALRPDHTRVGDPQLADHPVVLVTRADAIAFAESIGARLPTNEEWSAAAGEAIWPWGDTFDPERCNCQEAAYGWTVPVRAHPQGASPCGAEQLAGNVWEWVADTREDGWGVVRGGCYLDTEHGLIAARELSADPLRATATTGFRVVFDERRSGWTGSS
ncbi:formylglycine-generating enzyme family protein [Solirubrobacter soli]|uniref:formylglycine-generating enzyme family protein n=1 Tax=Solirubrobacter soli TaxID=363832 RepID=UPI0004113B9B|nr:SUMF1/EgtB/PvdO family nonheme iron enzyme [Solirubrobacter soli]